MQALWQSTTTTGARIPTSPFFSASVCVCARFSTVCVLTKHAAHIERGGTNTVGALMKSCASVREREREKESERAQVGECLPDSQLLAPLGCWVARCTVLRDVGGTRVALPAAHGTRSSHRGRRLKIHNQFKFITTANLKPLAN